MSVSRDLSQTMSTLRLCPPSRRCVPKPLPWAARFGAALLFASAAAACDNATGTELGGTAAAAGSGGSQASPQGGSGNTTTDTGGSAGGLSVTVPPQGLGQTIEGGNSGSGFQTFSLTIDGDAYNVQTNPWGGADQTFTAGGDFVFRVDAMQEPEGGESWDVAAFPSVYKGTAQGGNPTTDSGMPIQVNAITSVQTGLSINSTSATFTGNTTYDVYFTDRESYTSGGPDVYLMVWFDSHGLNPINGDDEQWNCRSDPPNYVDSCSDAGSLQVGDLTFYRFVGSNGAADVISYVVETPMDHWEFDLKDFIDDAVGQGVVGAAQYLQSIQAGFELVSGGAGLAVGGFYADVR